MKDYLLVIMLHFNTSNVEVLLGLIVLSLLINCHFNTSNVEVLLKITYLDLFSIFNFNTSNVEVLLYKLDELDKATGTFQYI